MSHSQHKNSGTTDADLIRIIRSDPTSEEARRAAGELLHRHQDAVYVWCFRFTGDRDRALDLAQDVLYNAYRSIASFQGRSGFSSWLFSIARNRCLSEVRRPSLFVDEEPNPEITMDQQAISADRQLEYDEMERWIRNLMTSHLNTQEQDVVCLRCFEGYSLGEIARVISAGSAESVRVILQRARRKLRAAADQNQRDKRMRILWKENAKE